LAEDLRRAFDEPDDHAKVKRLVAAIADGCSEFREIRELLGQARTDRDRLAGEIDQLDQLPVVALHPTVIADYRNQVTRLNAALAENPEARLEAIPKLRTLIDVVKVSPAEQGRGVSIEVTGKLASMLALATGKGIVNVAC
jgi:hypothetical protein